MASIAGYFYLTMLMKLNQSNSTNSILLISVAIFLGNYLAQLVIDKFDKDGIYVFEIIPDTNENGKKLADVLRRNDLALLTYKGYNNKNQVLCVKVFSQSKKKSKFIKDVIPDNFTYHISETKHYFDKQI